MSEQSMTLIEWLYERLDNCNRLAKEKRGADKAGWIEDASYFEAAIDMASDAATLRGYIRTYGETPTMTAASRDRWKQRAEQSDLALAEARNLLSDLHDYLLPQEDADHNGSSFVPNQAMRFVQEIDAMLGTPK
jgi:hypothetical protein